MCTLECVDAPKQPMWAWVSLQCALLGDVDMLTAPAWQAEAAGELVSVLFPQLFLQAGNKRQIWQGFFLLFCLELWETKYPGRLKARSCIHLHHCQITVMTSDVRDLKEFGTWLNPHCQGTLGTVFYSCSTFSFWSSRSSGENCHKALRYLSR